MAGNLWTQDELSALREAYPTGGARLAQARIKRLARKRTLDSIRQKASALGISAAAPETNAHVTGSVAVRLPPALVRKLDAAREGTTRSEFIRNLLTRELNA